jgi:uncharacterized OB-fold protein
LYMNEQSLTQPIISQLTRELAELPLYQVTAIDSPLVSHVTPLTSGRQPVLVNARSFIKVSRKHMAKQISLVEYLDLGDPPHLRVHECTSCGARFFDRRNACASCGKLVFTDVALPTTGELTSYTIVHVAAPGVEVPFIAALVNCGGTTVRTNLVNIEPDPTVIKTGIQVRLITLPVGADSEGVEAVRYAFEPLAREI